MKILQSVYCLLGILFWGCQTDQPAAQPTPCSVPTTLSADEAHQKGIALYESAADTTYMIRQQLADSAICYFKQELQLRQQQLGINHWRTHKARLNIGVIYQHDLYDLVTAQQYYESALFDSQTNQTDMNTIAPLLEAEILYNIGVVTERLGEYDLGKSQAIRADSLFKAKRMQRTDSINYLNNLLNLADIETALKAPIALQYFKQVVQITQQVLKPIPKPTERVDYEQILIAAQLNRGIAYRLMRQFKDAETDLLQAQQLCTQREDSANVRIELAKLYLDKNQYDTAKNYALQSLQLRKDYPKGHPVLAEVYTVLGQIYLKINQLEKAKKAFGQAVGKNTGAVLETWNVSKTYSPWQIEALKQLADLQTEPQKASDDYEKLCQMLHYRRVFLKTSAAKLNLTQQARDIFDKSISLNYQLYEKTKTGKTLYLNRILNDMEQSKAVLMSEQIQNNYATQYAGILDSIRRKERFLRLSIAQTERLLMENSNNFKQNQQKLSEQYQLWQQFTAHLQQNYPKYFQFKHQPPPQYTIEQIQKNLPKATGLISYYLNTNTLHILAIDKTIAKTYQIPLDTSTTSFEMAYIQYQQLLPLKNWDKTQHEVFSESAYFLYQQLLEQLLRDFSPQTQILSILPDDKLANFNFSSLLTQKAKDMESPKAYLIKKYAPQLAYNVADMGILNPSKGQATRYRYAGFSNNFAKVAQKITKTKGYEALDFAQSHIRNVIQQFGNGYYSNTEMNLSDFRKFAPQSKIIELVSHGSYDATNHYAAIAFPKGDSVEWFDLNQVYNWDFSANEFIALIACETGKGYILKGETIISMAYSFGYAGSKRRLSAFWSIPHRNSMELMDHFFANLAKTQNTALALQRAQQLFLKDKSANNNIPYYWAALVPSGSIQPLRLN